jgi:hypothetical protein
MNVQQGSYVVENLLWIYDLISGGGSKYVGFHRD